MLVVHNYYVLCTTRLGNDDVIPYCCLDDITIKSSVCVCVILQIITSVKPTMAAASTYATILRDRLSAGVTPGSLWIATCWIALVSSERRSCVALFLGSSATKQEGGGKQGTRVDELVCAADTVFALIYGTF